MVVRQRASPKRPDKEAKMIAAMFKFCNVSADIVTSQAGRAIVVPPWLLNVQRTLISFPKIVTRLLVIRRVIFLKCAKTPSFAAGSVRSRDGLTVVLRYYPSRFCNS